MWKDVHRDRCRGVGWDSTASSESEGRPRPARARVHATSNSLAPVGLFITVDDYLARGNWADAGMYVQTLMLPPAAWPPHLPASRLIQFQEPIFKHLQIPDDQVLVTGMSLGYADDSAIENTLVSDREELETSRISWIRRLAHQNTIPETPRQRQYANAHAPVSCQQRPTETLVQGEVTAQPATTRAAGYACRLLTCVPMWATTACTGHLN